ncbi:MAG: PrgI family protein [Candidatus Yanofskybacteria bacterium]|nr:PrgI family protein [Candidatus Yanofskybacteria bacterium]
MRFQLPQFIETETKLVGPLTLKQFLWVAGGAAILFLLFMTAGPSLIFFAAGIPVAGIFLALAFLKIDEMPLINYIAYLLSYLLNPKRYIFKKTEEDNLKFKNQSAK